MATNTETVDHDCVEKVDELLTEKKEDKTTNEFVEKSSKTDLAFVVEGERLYVSKLVIEMISPVFEKILGEQVKNEEGLFEIEITEYNLEDFNDFLMGFYPGKHKKVSESSVFRILPLAHKFGVESLMERCEYRLLLMMQCDTTPRDIFSKCMTFSYDFKLEIAKNESLNIFKTKQDNDYTQLCIPLPTNNEAKSDILETLLPRFFSTENKLAYSLECCPKDLGIFLSSIADCQYRKLELYVKPEFACTGPFIKGDYVIEFPGMNFRFVSYRNSDDVILRLDKVGTSQTSPDLCMAVLYRIHNISKTTEDISIAKQFTGLSDISKQSRATLDSQLIQTIQKKKFLVNGMVRITVHVLVNIHDRNH